MVLCKKCKHLKSDGNTQLGFDFLCKAVVKKVDPVHGFRTFAMAEDVNANMDCEKYEPVTGVARIWNFLR
jgi:hypothetical protein